MIAKYFNQKDLKKRIYKHYKKNNQVLSVDTLESGGCSLVDVFYFCSFPNTIRNITQDSQFLFEIITEDAFKDIHFRYSPSPCDIIHGDYKETYETIDTVAISCHPFYFDRTFFVRHKGYVTKEDILLCTEYFIHQVLNMHLIWNIKVLD